MAIDIQTALGNVAAVAEDYGNDLYAFQEQNRLTPGGRASSVAEGDRWLAKSNNLGEAQRRAREAGASDEAILEAKRWGMDIAEETQVDLGRARRAEEEAAAKGDRRGRLAAQERISTAEGQIAGKRRTLAIRIALGLLGTERPTPSEEELRRLPREQRRAFEDLLGSVTELRRGDDIVLEGQFALGNFVANLARQTLPAVRLSSEVKRIDASQTALAQRVDSLQQQIAALIAGRIVGPVAPPSRVPARGAPLAQVGPTLAEEAARARIEGVRTTA